MGGTITAPSDHVGGESLRYEFDLEEPDGSTLNLTDYTATWVLLPDEESDDAAALLTNDDSSVNLDFIDRSTGRLDIVIARGATEEWSGEIHFHRLTLDDPTQGRQEWSGIFPIK